MIYKDEKIDYTEYLKKREQDLMTAYEKTKTEGDEQGMKKCAYELYEKFGKTIK